MLRYIPYVTLKVAEGCREHHAFIIDMFSDMYDNPEAYGMYHGIYEAFLKERNRAD
jgi:hypothetical protein